MAVVLGGSHIGKRIYRRRLLPSYKDRLLAGFLAGVVCGTVAANLIFQNSQDQMGYFTELFYRGAGLSAGEQKDLLFWVCRQRIIQVLIAWLMGLTVFSIPCYYILAAGCGISVGMILSVTTCQKGFLGIYCYLLTLMPHGMFYIPVWLILASWAGEQSGKLRLLSLAALLILTVLGAAAETYLNPYFLRLML